MWLPSVSMNSEKPQDTAAMHTAILKLCLLSSMNSVKNLHIVT